MGPFKLGQKKEVEEELFDYDEVYEEGFLDCLNFLCTGVMTLEELLEHMQEQNMITIDPEDEA